MQKLRKNNVSMFSAETLSSLEMAEILGGVTTNENCTNIKGCQDSTNTGTCINFDCQSNQVCGCLPNPNSLCNIDVTCVPDKDCVVDPN